jgi:hypothetical protein
MAEEIRIIPPGTEVLVGREDSSLRATVTQVCIAGLAPHITYECAWISAGNRYSHWCQEHEVRSCAGDARRTIGFRAEGGAT